MKSIAVYCGSSHGSDPIFAQTAKEIGNLLAVNNIKNLVDKLKLDLFTEVINWEEMKDLQLSFFKSGVPHIDIPQDMAYMATLFNFANKHNIKYMIGGGNYATEGILPDSWFYDPRDKKLLKSIHKKFGTTPIIDNLTFLKSIINIEKIPIITKPNVKI